MKPVLFNTEMVRAILDGRKTVTRRLVKPAPRERLCTSMVHPGTRQLIFYETLGDGVWMAPYKIGDILYVRETWRVRNVFGDFARDDRTVEIDFKAGGETVYLPVTEDAVLSNCWKPSIHMPKEAARIFLRVKYVRTERLQSIDDDQAKAEGIRGFWLGYGESGYAVDGDATTFYDGAIGAFAHLWDSTIKPADLGTYGWDANPWVWVIEFERISKEEAMEGGSQR